MMKGSMKSIIRTSLRELTSLNRKRSSGKYLTGWVSTQVIPCTYKERKVSWWARQFTYDVLAQIHFDSLGRALLGSLDLRGGSDNLVEVSEWITVDRKAFQKAIQDVKKVVLNSKKQF